MNTHPATQASDWFIKVPAITLSFWIVKIMCTTVGETGADYLAVALAWQLRTRRYTPWIYWLTVVLVSVVGTQITDLFTDKLGVSLYVSTSVFAVLLAIIFRVWWAVEHTLSIHDIDRVAGGRGAVRPRRRNTGQQPARAKPVKPAGCE